MLAMIRRPSRGASLVVALAMLTLDWARAPVPELAQAGAPQFVPTACSFNLPDGQVAGQTVRCGNVLVPEDRSRPDAGSIFLPVAVFRSHSAAPNPVPTIYLEGGPGVSGLFGGVARSLNDAAFADAVLGDRDLIVFDQRGTGIARPSLACPEVLAVEQANLEVEVQIRKASRRSRRRTSRRPTCGRWGPAATGWSSRAWIGPAGGEDLRDLLALARRLHLRGGTDALGLRVRVGGEAPALHVGCSLDASSLGLGHGFDALRLRLRACLDQLRVRQALSREHAVRHLLEVAREDEILHVRALDPHTVAGGGLQLPVTGYPTRQRNSRRGRILAKTPTARFQTAHADQAALLAQEVVALATGTARTLPRERNETSSKAKHDDGSSRTSRNPHTRTAVGQ